MSAIVIRVVMIASLTDSQSDDAKPAKPITEPKALIPAKRSADHSGRRKYTPARMRTTQRSACRPGGRPPGTPPLGGTHPPEPPLGGSLSPQTPSAPLAPSASYRSHLAALRWSTT